jgi:hypothetical protein
MVTKPVAQAKLPVPANQIRDLLAGRHQAMR